MITPTNNPATPVYGTAADTDVLTRVVYLDASNVAFYDEAHTNDKKVPAADMLKLFLAGVVGKKGTTYYIAKSCTTAGVITWDV